MESEKKDEVWVLEIELEPKNEDVESKIVVRDVVDYHMCSVYFHDCDKHALIRFPKNEKGLLKLERIRVALDSLEKRIRLENAGKKKN